MPTRESHVAFRNDGSKIGESEFVRREGEAEISLGERRDRTPKGGSHGRSFGGVNFNRDKRALMKVYGEARSSREIIKELLKVGDVVRNRTNDNESIIGILEDGTGQIINKRVEKEAGAGGLEEKLLEDISNDVEKERGERV
jgi:hypothetical protein